MPDSQPTIPDSLLTNRTLLRLKYLRIHWEYAAFLICFIGISIVYLTHLGVVPVHAMADECRRALVALEMCISGNFLTPTINGEVYLNKPPLFSWILATSFHVFGNYSAFALRFPVVLSILIHGLLIYFFVRRYCSDAVAGMTALAFMTNGRTLMFDSMLGLLEHTLAVVIYMGFMVIFIFGEKQKYRLLFAISYFITALGFLIKGLPAVAHQIIALLVYFIYTQKTRILFSRYHITGVFVFLFTLGLYYIPFFLQNQISPEILLTKILNESSKRYYFNGLSDFFSVLLDYPVDFVYHFLPWTIFLLLLIRKNIFMILKENKFVWYNSLLFIANTPVYWFASLKNPHYLYFLIPSLFTILFYVYFKEDKNAWQKNLINIILWTGIGAGLVAAGILPFSKLEGIISGVWIKSIFLGIAFFVLFFLFNRLRPIRLFLFIGAIILVRLAFNWFVIPQRVSTEQVYADNASQVHAIVKHAPLFILAEYPAGFYDGITFYMEKNRNEILRLQHNVDDKSFYLVDDVYMRKYPNELLLRFPYEYLDNHLRYKKEMYLVKFMQN